MLIHSGFRIIATLLAFTAIVSISMAQEVGGITVEQANDTVRIHYTVNVGRPGDLCKAELLVSTDGGLTFNIRPKMTKGLDRMIRVGTPHEIVWAPLAENVELNSDNVVFKVVADLLKISDEVEFVHVQGGEFMMGDYAAVGEPDELPVHYVTLSNFDLGIYEVTNLQYCKFLNEYMSEVVKIGEFSGEPLLHESPGGIHREGITWTVRPGLEDYPVCNVTWFGATEFCRVKGYRLPTEAEWEYAARVQGKKIQFADGKDVADPEDINFDASKDSLSSFFSESRDRGTTTRVGIFPPNGLGLYDMSGNAWEWCQDWYHSEYYASLLADPKPNPAGPWFGNYKVIRGGGFGNTAHGIRTTARSFIHPGRGHPDIGFRVVRK
jgi:formylglycine-generating enzyme required for sulfatase activity